ncbi:sugar phosphate nucleotidyltransferase [Amylibacter sp.]|nr:sugar phosphate nucleotidyltransferase [Amylibacter sp.]
MRKTVFPVAGFGSRLLPATKAIPKELLPIIDKPLLQYAIEEAINTLIFVTGKNKRAVEDHFDSNTELDLTLRAQGKDKQADMVCNIIPEHVKYIFLRQPERHGLGHVILCAERAVNNKPFTILLADDFIISSHLGDTDKLICEFNNSGKAQLSVMEIN